MKLKFVGMNIKLNARIILLVVIFLQLVSSVNAASGADSTNPVSAGGTASGQACSAAGDIVTITAGNFSLNWSNWRIYLALGLMISAALIAMLYMFARVIRDEGLMARSREEVLQLALTVTLSIFFIAFVEFLCSSTALPTLLGLPQGNLFDGAESYLTSISTYTRSGFQTIFFFSSILTWYESYSEKAAGQNALTWGFAGGLRNLAPKALITMFLFAYLSANLHIYLLHFILVYCLMFLIPVGIVLRSFFPFRRFGGALLGVGIAFSILFPFLLLIDSVIMGSYFQNPEFLGIDCSSNYECMSKVCRPGSEVDPSITGNICYPSPVAGGPCDADIGDWQCISGRCIEPSATESSNYNIIVTPSTYVATSKVCADTRFLGVEDADCTSDGDCLPSLWCKGSETIEGFKGKCSKQSELGKPCLHNNQCGMPGQAFCNTSSKCQVPKTIGDNCSENIECASLYCESTAGISGKTCKEVKSDYRQLAIDIGKSSTGSENLFSKISPLKILGKIVQPVIIALFGGVLLPLINFMLLTRAVKDTSGFFGAETDIAGIYKIL